MQVEGNWKAAANLQLLLGETHPPARIEHPAVLPPPAAASAVTAARPSVRNGGAHIDARNTVNFRTTTYGGLQDPHTPRVRATLIAYYRAMLARIPLARHTAMAAAVVPKSEAPSEGAVKAEPEDDDDGDEAGRAGTGWGSGPAGVGFRALGILTQVHECVGDREKVPWEFYAIPHPEDDEAYDGPIQALQRDVPQDTFPLLFPAAAGERGEGARAGVERGGPDGTSARQGAAVGDALGTAAESGGGRPPPIEGQRLSLYPRLLESYTGLYPGMAVGIMGDPFQRTARGVLTGVLLRGIVLPCRPVLPWRVDRPLGPGAREQRSVRVHFCSGPFPRRDTRALLRAVTRQALHRGAHLLIIGGPLIKPFEDFEREVLPSLGVPFSEMLDGYVDTLEETLADYYAGRPHVPHLKIVVVSHRDDVTQAPVLPTTMYALSDTPDVSFRSNPCRISVNGVHFVVCNEDVVGRMRDVMVERWPTEEGSLRRVVEALVQSRWYTPVTELPMATVDMKHLANLRLDHVPAENELLQFEQEGGGGEGAADGAPGSAPSTAEDESWDLVVRMARDGASGEPTAKKEEADMDDADAVAGERKRVKYEPGAAPSHSSSSDVHPSVVECMPHVLFLPSTRPQFAYVTHRGVLVDHKGPRWVANDVVDECALDETAKASGVLVVNQEIWSRRASQRFELRVAEVTIPDSHLVARRGASAANGVACGVLHLFNADKR